MPHDPENTDDELFLVATGDVRKTKLHKGEEDTPHKPKCKRSGSYRPVELETGKQIIGVAEDESDDHEWKCIQCFYPDEIDRSHAGDIRKCHKCGEEVKAYSYWTHVISHGA